MQQRNDRAARPPPAIAVTSATQTTGSGPSHAPTAAKSFTSPAPIPRSAKHRKE